MASAGDGGCNQAEDAPQTTEVAHPTSDQTADPVREPGAVQEGKFQEMLTELVHNLNRSNNSAGAFGIFVDSMEKMFPGVSHISLLLLPTMKQTDAASRHDSTTTTTPHTNPSLASPTPRKTGKQAKPANAAQQQSNNGTHQQTTTDGFRDLDWSNTCMFKLAKGRGAIVQPHPEWPLVCSAAYHAAAVADGVVTTSDYHRLGPHFLDWQTLAAQGNAAMTSVPIYCWKKPVAVLTMASRDAGAFDSEDTMVLLSALLSPYVQLMDFTTRRGEMERLVHSVLTPLAAELSVKQGRFKRVKNVNGEDVLCLDESRSSHRRKTSAAGRGDGTATATNIPNSRTLALVQASASMGVRISGPPNMDRPPPSKPTPPDLKASLRSPEADSGGKHLAVEAVDLSYLDQPDLDWSDFLFNLISMCIVYAYFSKAAATSESITAVLLCMAVASFDILLLLMRWLWYDHYLNYGLVLCIFQIYRAMLLPVANTWMLWSLIHKMGIELSTTMHIVQGVCLGLCYVFALKLRFLLNVPVQLATVIFSATTASNMCDPTDTAPHSIFCMFFVTCMQLVLGLVLPMIMLYLLDVHGGRSFMPHVQAKRWVLQA